MRKRVIAAVQQDTSPLDQDWLNVEGLAEVEITSEDATHPIESALLPGEARAGVPVGQGSRRSGSFLRIRNGSAGSG